MKLCFERCSLVASRPLGLLLRLSVVILLLCFLSSRAYADKGVIEIGAKGAVSWGGHSDNRTVSYDVYKPGGSVGGALLVGMSSWLAVQGELLYSTRRSDVFTSEGEYIYSIKQRYLQLPILARGRFLVRGPVRGYVVAGPVMSYLLSGKMENEDGPLDDDGDEIRSFDISLTGGVGAAWEIAPHWSIVLEARYDAGLMDIYVDARGFDLKLENRTFLLTLGVGRTLNDTDRDGIPNHADRCGREAEDVDGFEDQDGCRDVDVDADGILDEEDACSYEAEDKDGFEDQDGCPDTDNDGDGILDVKDQCPDNAFPESEDGCPPPYKHVKVVGDRLELTPGILFKLSETEVTEEHKGVLDEVAQVLADYPDMRLRIEGHADTEGGKRTNDEVSELRAREVFLYLTVEKKIDRDRLDVEGYGMRKPRGYEGSPEDRAQNRRVELVIIAGP